MFAFLKRRIYRNQFIVYFLSLFLACAVVCIGLLYVQINNQVTHAQQAVQTVFETAESSLSTITQHIDTYFLQMYSSQNMELQNDFTRFLGSSAENYMLQRLREVPAGSTAQSFIDSMSDFVSNNQFAISEILCLPTDNPTRYNALRYSPNGSCDISFLETNTLADTGAENISDGFRYVKKVSNSAGETLGEMVFIIRTESVFPDSLATATGSVAAVSAGGELLLTPQYPNDPAQIRSIYLSDSNHGAFGSMPFSKKYYTVFTSENHRYKLISILDLSDITAENPALIFGTIGGTIFIFLFITSLLALRMSYDARYLGQITGAIDHAKAGHFTKIPLGKRHDEYSIIAAEFNTMSDDLNAYIQREYILKLRQKEAQMKRMQQQIHPHFLYNTLEVIRARALINHDAEVADAVYNLGSMFRSMVKGEDVITVQEELDILTKYLHLMEFKYMNRFFYQIDADKTIRDMQTPKFWMQPLAENFFVHGFMPETELNLMVIHAAAEQLSPHVYALHFEILNNGMKIEDEKLRSLRETLSAGDSALENGHNESIGLQNVCQRLRYFYGNSLKMDILNNDESGITITIDAVYTDSCEEEQDDV